MNKKWQKIISNFNTPDTALVVSAWPVEGKNAINHGIAWYTRMMVNEMAKSQKKKFVILAETNHDNRPRLLMNGRVLVLRVFDNTKKSLYPKILTWLKPFKKVKKVYVHSEFGANGGMSHFAMILPFLTLIRLMKKKIIFYSHNVITDVSMLSGHLNLSEKKVKVLNSGISLYYRLLSLLSQKIVVLDPVLGKRLNKYMNISKIVSLKMPVEKKKKIGKQIARKKLGLPSNMKIVITFGFVSWYKGSDWLVENIPDNIFLVVAGGPSYSLMNKPYYQEYYSKVLEKISKKKNIITTGFVPEDKIGHYMSAADLVVMPYRGLMGSSGSLSHALSYEKPFLLSKSMGDLLKNMKIKKNDVLFSMKNKGMTKIVKTLNSVKQLNKLSSYSQLIVGKRDLAKMARYEYNKLYA